jgi:hypothetical protein
VAQGGAQQMSLVLIMNISVPEEQTFFWTGEYLLPAQSGARII